jgi:hypothetical protein
VIVFPNALQETDVAEIFRLTVSPPGRVPAEGGLTLLPLYCAVIVTGKMEDVGLYFTEQLLVAVESLHDEL